MDFSTKTRDSLSKIELMISSKSINQDLISDLFCEKSHKKGMTAIQELQLVVDFCEYFQCPGPETTRNFVFLSLFGGTISKQRTRVLSKLISTSISALIAPLLCAAGTWMQQLGANSQPAKIVAENLITHFVTFSTKVCEQLESLPLVAPRFAANFMTAVCDLYLNDGKFEVNPPPSILLSVFSEWVFENPELCLASQQPLALPSGAIAMPVVTPLAGLIRWCVLAPIYDPDQNYSKLHLAILRSFQQAPSQQPTTAPSSIINAQHLSTIVNTLQMALVEKERFSQHQFELSLERFAQSIQVALSADCVYGNIIQLLCRLETLPHNPLLDIVIKAKKI